MKHNIIIKGLASTNALDLNDVLDIECQDNFADYFDNDFSFRNDIKDGYMNFVIENNELYTIVQYISLRKLNDKELDILLDYTIGQLSDGIGKGFEQNPVGFGPINEDVDFDEDEDEENDSYEGEIFVSPWVRESDYIITQTAL